MSSTLMDKPEFNKLDVTEQLKYINELLAEGQKLSDISKKIGISRTTFRARFFKIDYVYNSITRQYDKDTKLETPLYPDITKIPRKIYLQYAGKEIEEDTLLKKFKFEWCKEYKIKEIKDLKIYYNLENKKAYFVVNKLVTIIIDFE